MDDELRSEKRAAWQARTPLRQRWLISLAVFVFVLIVMAIITWL